MLIFEGTDCTGKTTLAHACLSRLPGYVYQHLSKPDPSFDFLWGYIRMYNPRAVYDRFFLSELVYTVCRGEGCRVEHWQQEAMFDFISKHCYVVLMTASDEHLTRLAGDKPEMYSLAQIKQANELFLKWWDAPLTGTADMLVSDVFDTEDYDGLVDHIVSEYSLAMQARLRA